MKKRAIPQVPKPDQTRQAFDIALKENIEVITGRRDNRIDSLPANANTAAIISKINELIELLQG